ncbi:MAG: bifunctional DNA primase/polymerase [Desulfuromusa sp.]|nr:bifunctional DNA primase/polymerase [Desulfuromusa sp.]
MTLKDHALNYAKIGYLVFPCRDKKPLTPHGFKDATNDPTVIAAWWDQSPDAQIGAPTGKEAGFFVLDIDQPHGPNSLKELELKDGPLPITAEQRTGGGGRHLFFKYPEGITIKNSAGKLGTGLDTRGDGGYIIMSPSLHKSGNCYEWINVEPMAEAPEWLLELVTSNPSKKKKNNHLKIVTSQYGLSALDDEAAEVSQTPEGSRNHRLNQGAFRMGQLVAGGELDFSQAEDSLFSAAISSGLPECEAEKTISNGLSAGMEVPRNALTAMFKGANLSNDLSEVIPSIVATTDSMLAAPLVKSKTAIDFIHFEEMVNRQVKTQWLIKGFFDQRSIILLFGETGSMKSFVAIDIGLCIVTGKDWHGHAVKHSGPVFYICGEGFSGISKRLKAWQSKYNGGGDES